MSDKPQKRLVSKGKYLYLRGKQMSLLTLTMSSFYVGVLLALTALIGLILLFVIPSAQSGLILLTLLATSSIAALFLLVARILSRKTSEVEDVQPLTAKNAHLLPPEDTLVRASDIPSYPQSTTLLRVAPYGKEMPAEELLRAGEESTPDV